MHKNFSYYLDNEFVNGGFRLHARDAHQTAKNISLIFTDRTGWFKSPKPIHIDELCEAYKKLVPDMEIHHPGHIDMIFHPNIISKLGFPVDSSGMVSWD